MRSDFLLGLTASGFHKIFYTDWGDPASERAVICVHGLTRNCRDFDFLAQALAADFRVVCPDIAGRGRSDWLYNKDDYSYPQYMADMNALISRVLCKPAVPGLLGKLADILQSRFEPRSLYWVGTSMGGMLGMLLASRPNSPIRKLVVNDVGPLIPKASLERIATYVGKDPRFKTLVELETYVRAVSAPFGPLTDAQWQHLTVTGAKQHEDGAWGMSYDPDLSAPFRKGPAQDVNLWTFWDTITCPTLILRGADSDLLLKSTAEEMQTRGPRARLVEFAGIGHAPVLMAEDQIKVVRDFLLEPA
ncbi:MAG: Alpha/beta hydrolase [Betaproteobacteria bacterium]|nr:Alpha/beta hydrolase [Betaproteobacteria bacterium]